jgi:hypothetical protein
MKVLQRAMTGLVAIAAVIALQAQASAQVLKHVRDDALVVIKLNNAQAVNDKLVAMSQKMGLANLHPAAANPLGVLQQQQNLKQGLNLKGETALVVFAPIAGENEPRAMALIPVADYKAFLTNFADVKKDGEADTFALQADGEPLFAEQWGEYAAITPWKDLLAEKPQGLQVNGVIAKQFQEKDLTVYVTGTVMEEDCDGLCWQYILREKVIAPKPELVVIAEPTNMNIYRGHRGRMEIELTVPGVSAHGSAPERGVNAVYKMAPIMRDIEKLNERLKDDPFLGKGTVTSSHTTSSAR